MAFGKKRDDVLRRSVPPFPIEFNELQIDVLWKKIGANLWLIWDECKRQRDEAFDAYFAPLYEARRNVRKAGLPGLEEAVAKLTARLKAQWERRPLPDLGTQINALTSRRASDPAFEAVPRNWQEEGVKMLDGAYRSFAKLRANGDTRAQIAGPRSEWDFVEIRGRAGFSILLPAESAQQDARTRGARITLSCGNYGKLSFPIPSHQENILRTPGIVVKSFTLFRDKPDMRTEGRFWISISYEIPKPASKEFAAEDAAYLSLGASSVGVVSKSRRYRTKSGQYRRATVNREVETTIMLDRPDLRLKPVIADITAYRDRCTEGSRQWKKRNAALDKKWKKLKRQQKQAQREAVARKLLPLGEHFVISDLVVRGKKGALADKKKTERGGMLGANAAAQGSGNLGRLPAQLQIKAPEHGGSVRKHRLSAAAVPPGKGHENKVAMARALREDFLKRQE